MKLPGIPMPTLCREGREEEDKRPSFHGRKVHEEIASCAAREGNKSYTETKSPAERILKSREAGRQEVSVPRINC